MSFLSKLVRNPYFIICVVVIGIIQGPKIYGEIHTSLAPRPRPILLRDQMMQLSPNESATFPIYAGCQNPERGELKIKSEVTVTDEFAKANDLWHHPEMAAELQLKYLNGYFNHDLHYESAERVYVLPDRKIHITKVEKARYPRELDIDWLRDDERLYPARFQQMKKVNAGANALKITYEASQGIVTCGAKSSKSEIDVKLPRDPYLAFWSVPTKERRVLRFGSTELRTNPCSYKQMAELVSPSMYWYAWSPDAHGKDEGGKTFDCRQILNPKTDFLSLSADFKVTPQSATPWDFQALEKSPELDVRLIMGLYSEQSSRADLDHALKLLRYNPDVVKTAEAFSRREIPVSEIKSVDPSTRLLLGVIRSLDLVTDIRSSRIADLGKYVSLRLDGVLKDSKKPYRLTIFYGSTDQPQKKAVHWDFLKDAIAESPLIFYIGHSGMGQNMSIAQMQSNLKLTDDQLKTVFKAQPYQLLAIISCFGNSYFGDDYLAHRLNPTAPELTTDLVLTATGENALFTIPASFLRFLDLDMAKKRPSLRKFFSIRLEPEDMVLVDRQLGGN